MRKDQEIINEISWDSRTQIALSDDKNLSRRLEWEGHLGTEN